MQAQVIYVQIICLQSVTKQASSSLSQLNNSSSNLASSVIVLFCDACILMGSVLLQLYRGAPLFSCIGFQLFSVF